MTSPILAIDIASDPGSWARALRHAGHDYAAPAVERESTELAGVAGGARGRSGAAPAAIPAPVKLGSTAPISGGAA